MLVRKSKGVHAPHDHEGELLDHVDSGEANRELPEPVHHLGVEACAGHKGRAARLFGGARMPLVGGVPPHDGDQQRERKEPEHAQREGGVVQVEVSLEGELDCPDEVQH